MQRPPSDHDLLPKLRELAPNIAARVGDTTPAGCWQWVGAFSHGYGTYTLSTEPYWYRSVRAHRAVFMLHHDRPIANGMTLHHRCRNPWCVNPAHLEELTEADNIAADATGGGSLRRHVSKKGDVTWRVLFREDGKQRSRTFPTREAAAAYADARTAVKMPWSA